MSRPVKYTLWVLGSLVFLVGVALAWLDWEMRPRPPDAALPLLVRNLPGETNKRTAAFRERVRARFHDGPTTATLTAELLRQGFHLRKYPKENLEMAVLEQHSAVCTEAWVISWASDPQDRARNIDAHDNLTCL